MTPVKNKWGKMNCCNNADESEKEKNSENHEERKTSWVFVIIAIIIAGLLLLGMLA